LALLWAIEIGDQLFFGGRVDWFGIHPRTWQGLGQIWLAPLLHVGFGHLLANSLPLLVLGWLVMLRHTRDFWLVALVATVVSGAGVWLLGRANTIHLGASGVIFGLLGFLLARAYFERSWAALGIALMAGMLYGGMLWGMLWGVLPGRSGISWLAHLFGALGGILAAWLMAPRTE
jgi:membrane associated rhomboid family serine protease